MRRVYILLCFCLLSLGCLQAQIQPPMVRWAVPISGCIRIDNMHVMPSGECYVIGIMLDTVCFDAAGLQCRHSIGKDKGRYNIFVAKYDPEGSFLWADLIGNRLTDNKWVEASCVDTDGNVYLSSYVSTAGMGDSLLVGDTVFTIPQRQGSWLAKLSPTGKPLWVTQWQSPGYTMHLASHAESGVYITGYGSASVRILNDSIPSVGKPRIYIAQLDGNDRIVRHTSIGSTTRIAIKIIHYPLHGVFAYGYFDDSLTFGELVVKSGRKKNNFCFRLNSELDLEWVDLQDPDAFDYQSARVSVHGGDLYWTNWIKQDCVILGDSIHENTRLRISPDGKIRKKWTDKYQTLNGFFAKSRYYTGCYYKKDVMSDSVIHFSGNTFVPFADYCTFMVRTDSNLDKVEWHKPWLAYPLNWSGPPPFTAGMVGMDTSGRMYGWGGMNALYGYLDSIKVQPLFYFNGEREHFIFGMTPDSFPPPAPPYPPDWRFYPNPYSTPLHVSGEFQAGMLSLRLLDLQGRELLHTQIPTQSGIQSLPVRLPQLAAGVYVLLLSQADKQLSAKLIVP